MIKRFFFIVSATLFILVGPNRGISAEALESRLEAMERLQTGPPEVPNGINYQAVLRDSNGQPMANKQVTMTFGIRSGNATGPLQWQETHTITTNAAGMVSLVIGKGTSIGGSQPTFAAIPWQQEAMYLQVGVNAGEGEVDLGTTPLLSVPYALAAANGLSTEQANKLEAIEAGAQRNVLPDWAQQDATSAAFILNKPAIPAQPTDINQLADADKLLEVGRITAEQVAAIAANSLKVGITPEQALAIEANTAKKGITPAQEAAIAANTLKVGITPQQVQQLNANTDKLGTIQTGAERNVQADWNETNVNSDAYIANKPTITTADQVFSVENNIISGGGAGESFVFGSTSMDDIEGDDDNVRMFFNKGNGAFRVGSSSGSRKKPDPKDEGGYKGKYSYIDDDSWDSYNVGAFSVAFGKGNIASGEFSVVGGGGSNNASGYYFSTVGGGFGNTASGYYYATVGGGASNRASGNSSTVGGGSRNTASGYYSTVGGGNRNHALGNHSTVSGGSGNRATGDDSTIPGGRGLKTSSLGATVLGHYNAAIDGTSDYSVDTDPLFVVGNGTYDGDRSDAFVMLRNGNSTLNGTLGLKGGLTIGDVGSSFTLPNTRGTADQVLKTDGGGVLTWADAGGGGAFTASDNLISGGIAGENFVFGSTQMDDLNGPVDDIRMFFNKTKGAIRAGSAYETLWDDDNVGYSSVAFGRDNKASGNSSTIGGGYMNQANNNFTTIGGGKNNSASGLNSTISGGDGNQASGFISHIGGGKDNNSAGNFTTIGGGKGNYANGSYSTISGGLGLNTRSFGASVFGHYNRTSEGTPAEPISTDPLFVIGNGSGPGKFSSDAFVMLRNGNSSLNGDFALKGSLTIGYIDGGTSFTLPNTRGTADQVLKTDAYGVVSWADAAGGSGSFTTASNLVYAGDADDSFVFGSTQLDDAPGTADDKRMFFDKNTGAFRVGAAYGTQWDAANLGQYSSISGGYNNQAKKRYSTVGGGYGNTVNSDGSTIAGGNLNQIEGGKYNSIGGGERNTINESSYRSIISGGNRNSVTGRYVTIGGGRDNTITNSFNSIISGGANNSATSSNATIGGGFGNQALAGGASILGGGNNFVTGSYSAVGGGRGVKAQSYGEFAVGLFSLNAANPSANYFVETDRIFTVGNGTDENARSNAFTILKNGNATLAGTLTHSSDSRLKRNIAPIGATLAKVNQLEAVTYKWNDLTPRDTAELNIGLIAQEVEKLFPELVKEGSNGYKSVNYIHLVPVLIEAVKELSAQNEQLKSLNTQMEVRQSHDESRFVQLEAKLNALVQLLAPAKADSNSPAVGGQ